MRNKSLPYRRRDGAAHDQEEAFDEFRPVQGMVLLKGVDQHSGDAPVVSFISDKNENVNSVQFVIKTAAIEKEEVAEVVAEEETPTGFFQKLLALFRK